MAALTAITLLPVIEDVISKGKSQLNTKDIRTDIIPVHTALAPCYGSKGKENITKLDAEMKIMVMAAVNKMNELKVREWKHLVAAMMTCVACEPEEKTQNMRADTYRNAGNPWLRFKGLDQKVVAKVHAWFINVIKDSDVLQDTKIGIGFLARLVESADAWVESLLSVSYRCEYRERRMVDVGVLRYPDIDKSYFKLYRIQIKAWADCRRYVFRQNVHDGFKGTFQKMKFYLRGSVISKIQNKYRENAIKDVELLFSNVIPTPDQKDKTDKKGGVQA